MIKSDRDDKAMTTNGTQQQHAQLATKFSLVLLNCSEPCILVDHDLRIVSFNEQVAQLPSTVLKQPLQADSSILDHLAAFSAEQLKQIFSAVFGGFTQKSCIRVDLNLQPQNFSIRYSPALESDKTIVGAFVTFTLLESNAHSTQKYSGDEDAIRLFHQKLGQNFVQRKSPAQLESTEEKERDLFMCNPIPMWVFDTETLQFLSANDAALMHYGYTRSEFLRMNLLDIRPVSERRKVEKIAAKSKLSDDFFSGEFNHYKKDGSLIRVNVKSNSIVFSGKAAKLVAITDITRQKEEEQRLKLLESIITHATDAVMILETFEFDPGTAKIIYVNEAFSKMSGYQPNEITGKTPALFSGPDTSSSTLDELSDAIRLRRPCEVEIIHYKKDCSAYWVEIAIAPVADGSGKFSHFIVIERDITSRKVQEKDQEKLIYELTQNNSDLRQFSYITSHNLRGPITSLMGLCMLLDNYNIEDKTLQQILDGVKKATYMFDGTIKDLTTVLNVRDRTSIPQEPIPFQMAYEKAIAQSEVLIEYSGASLSADFEKAPLVTYNRAYLESIFSNLITNAIKYRSPKRKLKIHITTEINEQYLVLKFSDNGLGIDMDLHKDKIFKLYQRFHDHAEGKGLGLFLIKSQMEALKGSIELESKLGEGTCFILKFRNSLTRSNVGTRTDGSV